jgi:GH15 family glucan-1,4-alpha-glucosidase
MFNRLLSLANDVGLMSEEYDVAGGRLVGNFPQALTHISLVHTAFALAGMWKPDAAGTEPDH